MRISMANLNQRIVTMSETTKSYKTLRLILGDQLNGSHSWFKINQPNTLYIIAELKQEATYTKHHKQKIAVFFLGGRSVCH